MKTDDGRLREAAYLFTHLHTPRTLPENLLLLKELIEAGKTKPVIDRVYLLDQIAEAHRYAKKKDTRRATWLSR
jgi:NADPH:quinone reductase-like Zn-dependent oxidoreductase